MMQRLVRKLKSREAGGMVVRLVSVALLMLLNIALARLLGPKDFGDFTYVLSWIMLLSGLVRAGLGNLLVRDVAAYSTAGSFGLMKGLLRLSLGGSLAIGTAAAAALVLVTRYWQPALEPQTAMLYAAGAPIVLFLALTGHWEAATRGLGGAVIGQLSEFVVRPGAQLLIVAVLAAGLFPIGLTKVSAMTAAAVSAVAASATAYLFFRRMRPAQLASVPATFDRTAWFGSFLMLSGVLWIATFNAQANILALGTMKTSESVAYFQVAAQMTFLISIGLVVMNAVQAADYSSKFVASQFEDLQRLATYSARASLAIGLLMFAVYVLLGEPLLVLLFGPEYLQAYPALIILSVGHLVSAASGSVAILLYSSRNEQDVMMAIIIATLVNIALCILLIPGYGTAGAATASAASLASWNSILVWQVHKRLGIWSLPFAPRRRSQGSSGSGPAAR